MKINLIGLNIKQYCFGDIIEGGYFSPRDEYIRGTIYNVYRKLPNNKAINLGNGGYAFDVESNLTVIPIKIVSMEVEFNGN